MCPSEVYDCTCVFYWSLILVVIQVVCGQRGTSGDQTTAKVRLFPPNNLEMPTMINQNSISISKRFHESSTSIKLNTAHKYEYNKMGLSNDTDIISSCHATYSDQDVIL
eukprot:scpid103240/ scgid14476/ 